MAGWVYGAGSGGGGTPRGEDKDIQFNNNGAFSGSSKLITDGSGSLSASTTISASSFHGDGSNLTGLTASAVNVADGPEFSLQFRRDDPITGEISGSSALKFLTGSNTLSGTHAIFTDITASALSGNSPIKLHSSFEMANSTIPLYTGESVTVGGGCGNVTKINTRVTAACDFLFEQQVTASTGLSSSLFILDPHSGSIAGPGSYLGLDADNRIVITGSDISSIVGGSDTQVQFNDGGAFGGDTGLTYNKTTDVLTAVAITSSAGMNPRGPSTFSIQLGDVASKPQTSGILIGDQTSASAVGGIVIGRFAKTETHSSVVIGYAATGSDDGPGVGEGYQIVLGANSNAERGSSIAIGADQYKGATSVGVGSVAIGNASLASGSNSIAIGAAASGSNSTGGAIAIGASAKATGLYSIALGSSVDVPEDKTFGIGTNGAEMDVNITGNITLFNNNNTSYGNLTVCEGTASILHLSGCSPITVHTPMSSAFNMSASAFFAQEIVTTAASVFEDDITVKGQVKVGPGTGVGYVASNGDPDTRIRFGASGLGSDSMSIEAGGKAFIVLDENGRDELTLGTGVGDVVHVSGSLTASVGLRVSASAADGQDIFIGAGNDRTIGVLQDSGADFFVVGHDAGQITLSSSSGVEIVTDPTAGLGLFASPIKIYNDQNGDDTRLSLSTAGVVSASSTIHGTNFIRKQSPTIHGSHFSASNAASLYLVKVDSAPVTASLPGLTSAAQIGETYTFKDYLGSGSVNSLHISPSGSQEIDEGSQLTIEQAFGAATVTAVSSSTKGFSWVVTSTT